MQVLVDRDSTLKAAEKLGQKELGLTVPSIKLCSETFLEASGDTTSRTV